MCTSGSLGNPFLGFSRNVTLWRWTWLTMVPPISPITPPRPRHTWLAAPRSLRSITAGPAVVPAGPLTESIRCVRHWDHVVCLPYFYCLLLGGSFCHVCFLMHQECLGYKKAAQLGRHHTFLVFTLASHAHLHTYTYIQSCLTCMIPNTDNISIWAYSSGAYSHFRLWKKNSQEKTL